MRHADPIHSNGSNGHVRGTQRAEPEVDALVVGAGPAGMATAYALGKAGVRYRILERADRVGSAWHGYWDSLRLNSPRFLSSLPGLAIHRSAGRWPMRADMVAYFERYAAKNALPVEFGRQVVRVDRSDGLWRVETTSGSHLARAVVIATGLNAKPYTPPWPGVDGFTGTLVHAMDYHDPQAFAGKRVLVVGSGSTGKDIAVDLVPVAEQVRLSIRTPPLMYPAAVLGIPVDLGTQVAKRLPKWTHRFVDAYSLLLSRFSMGDLTRYGIGRPPEGVMKATESRGHGATIERGFVEAVKADRIGVLPAVEGFDGSDVILSGGARVAADVVIAATGQRTGLEDMVGHLDVLEADGRPRVDAPECPPNAPGLYFIGYRLPPGQLPDLRLDSRGIARAIRSGAGPAAASASRDGQATATGRASAPAAS